jgi:hypothetical protein
VNAKGVFFCLQRVAREMIPRRSGRTHGRASSDARSDIAQREGVAVDHRTGVRPIPPQAFHHVSGSPQARDA